MWCQLGCSVVKGVMWCTVRVCVVSVRVLCGVS